MTTYVDVDTSAEAIQEDEELIEAVNQIVEKTNQIVETAAEIIYEDVKNDVSGFYLQVRWTIEALFPFLIYWKEDRSLFWEDMYKLLISGVLFVLAFFILSPSQLWVKRSSSWRSFGNKTLSPLRTSSVDRFTYIQKLSSFCFKNEESSNRPALERRRSFSSVDPHMITHNAAGEDEEETEEESFANRFPSILQTRYRNLVLPPECKRVEKPRYSIPKKEDKKEDDEAHDDDNPLDRLVVYLRQFLHFVMSLLRYDFVGVGLSLIHWLESLSRLRESLKNPTVDFDDDESDAGSIIGKSSSNATHSSISAGALTPRSRSMRSKRDSLVRLASKRNTNENLENAGDPGETNDTQEKPRSSLIPEPPLLNEREGEEEKKEWLDEEEKTTSTYKTDDDASMATPPSTPPPTPGRDQRRSSSPLRQSHRRDSFASVYETPARDTIESPPSDTKELDPGEVLAAKLALHARFPSKSKDALENYRSSGSARKIPRLEMKRGEVSSMSLASGFLPDPAGFVRRESSSDSTYYFETVADNESLRKMAVEVPVPDRNGYILGDDFLVDNDCTPLLVFVNSRSGPQQGHLLITQLRGLLNPIQVWDLADGGPEEVLQSFSTFSRLRVLVCGGDGTVSWIVSSIEKMKLQRWPPIAILPLGTGNDLARVHGWGGGYSNESLVDILEQVAESYISWLDRWELTVENKKGKVKQVKSFFNYFGVGADAQMALQVHKLREHRPDLFFSRVINKAWYGIFGTEDAIKASSVNLPHEITLIADGVEVPLPSDSQGIILLNIDSYGGGVPLWSKGSPTVNRSSSLGKPFSLKRSKSLDTSLLRGKKDNPSFFDRIDSVEDLKALVLSDEEKYMRVTACNKPSSCQDGLLDVVSVRGSFHLGQIRVGLSTCQQLCQCRELSIIIKQKVSVQLDGEPWRQSACTLNIKRKKDAAIMLHRSANDSNGVETEMSKLLDWAEEKKHINSKTHEVLMKEFSRRIETKTRERRVRSQGDNLMFHLTGKATRAPRGGIMF